MDYEELKVIWDSQNLESLYAINEARLHASVQRKHRAFARRLFWRDARDITIGLVTGAGLLGFGWMLAFGSSERWQRLLGSSVEVSRWHSLALLIASGLWLFCAGFQWVERKRQKQWDRQFEPSLRGDLDRTLAQTEHQIRLARTAVWWAVVPVWLATALLTYVLCNIVPTPPAVLVLATVVILLGAAVDLRTRRRPLRSELLPLKHDFETLRRKLTKPTNAT